MTHVDIQHNSTDPNNRIPDLRRSERLNWVKRIIENYECSIEKDWELNKRIRKYENYKKQKTPLA